MGILCCAMEFASDFNLSFSEFGWDQPVAASLWQSCLDLKQGFRLIQGVDPAAASNAEC